MVTLWVDGKIAATTKNLDSELMLRMIKQDSRIITIKATQDCPFCGGYSGCIKCNFEGSITLKEITVEGRVKKCCQDCTWKTDPSCINKPTWPDGSNCSGWSNAKCGTCGKFPCGCK